MAGGEKPFGFSCGSRLEREREREKEREADLRTKIIYRRENIV